MLFLRFLCCVLSTIYPVFTGGVWDERCIDNCSCCIDGICGQNRFPNSCTIGCIDGHRGERCYELCQYENCKSCGGGTLSEVCEECYDGYYLGGKKDCTSPCPSTCKSCTSSAMCSKCKEGFYDENGSTTCPYSYCPKNCDCTINQKECVSCKNGFYNTSNSCNQTCSKYCEGDICERTSGFCINGCKSENITGDLCTDCIKGMFGELCDTMCSNNCGNITCERYNGTCSEGCTGNFNGTLCDLCISGKYGENCELECPISCADEVCEKTYGTCYDCIDNFKGEKCDECMSGFYGPNCDEPCSRSCIGGTCRQYDGVCINGCEGRHEGPECFLTEAQKDNEGKTSAILGSLFAVSVIINIVQGVFLFVYKRREALQRKASRQESNITYENSMMSTDPPFSPIDETKSASTDKITVYEETNEVHEAGEEYQMISNISANVGIKG